MNENKRQLSLDDKIDIILLGSLMLALAFTSCKGYQVIKRQQHYLDRNGITNYSWGTKPYSSLERRDTLIVDGQDKTPDTFYSHQSNSLKSINSGYMPDDSSRENKTIGLYVNATLTAKGVPEIDKPLDTFHSRQVKPESKLLVGQSKVVTTNTADTFYEARK